MGQSRTLPDFQNSYAGGVTVSQTQSLEELMLHLQRSTNKTHFSAVCELQRGQCAVETHLGGHVTEPRKRREDRERIREENI